MGADLSPICKQNDRTYDTVYKVWISYTYIEGMPDFPLFHVKCCTLPKKPVSENPKTRIGECWVGMCATVATQLMPVDRN